MPKFSKHTIYSPRPRIVILFLLLTGRCQEMPWGSYQVVYSTGEDVSSTHHHPPCCAVHTAQIKLNALLAAKLDAEVLRQLPLHCNMMIISVSRHYFIFHVGHIICYKLSIKASPTVLKNIKCTQRPYNQKIFSTELQKSTDGENMWESKGYIHYFFLSQTSM